MRRGRQAELSHRHGDYWDICSVPEQGLEATDGWVGDRVASKVYEYTGTMIWAPLVGSACSGIRSKGSVDW